LSPQKHSQYRWRDKLRHPLRKDSQGPEVFNGSIGSFWGGAASQRWVKDLSGSEKLNWEEPPWEKFAVKKKGLAYHRKEKVRQRGGRTRERQEKPRDLTLKGHY